MSNDLAIQDTLRALGRALQSAKHGTGTPLVERAAKDLSVSKATIFRKLKELGFDFGRKQRTDKGDSSLTREEAQTISAYLMAGTRATGKRIVSIEQALVDLRANSMIKAQSISADGEITFLTPNTVNRVMRELGLHPDQLKRPSPHVELASLHPNHAWQIDASVCVLFYLPKQGMKVMSDKEFYKNKPQNFKKIENDRVIRYTCTDHTTGTVQVRYYAGAETGINLADFFIHCIQQKESNQEPIHGVPFILMDDAGSANTSHLFNNLLDRLGVRHITHAPGNPRASGSVERAQNLVECYFESRLGVGKPVQSLDELNALADVWARWFNSARKHTRHGHTRYALWQTINATQLRVAPSREICQLLLSTRPETRVVDDSLRISYAMKGQPSFKYSVAHVPNVLIGEKLTVCINPYSVPAINVIEVGADGKEIFFECQPLAVNDYGYTEAAVVIGEAHKSVADTRSDTARKAGQMEAYGVETLEAVDAKKRAKVRPFADVDAITHLKTATVATYMTRSGTDMDIASPQVESKPWSHTKAATALVRRGVVMTPERNRLIKQWYPDGVQESEIDTLEQRLVARPNLRAVS
ncbi:DDE-type integrase/transposase/recombinase [Herminiimonas arsenitoxidans]|uniref:DDE-type integrase/transposase/recombinase n=1 Tax=Herminiimonas arsenitoxidans TaxID=1809410 RepID=UPI000970E776|nr:DDE-type integrase/transposase/recombinase [Herminiimonas arsenitoxidans]